MSSRMFSRSNPADFGLVAWLESTRVILPLKGVECRFAVTAGLASVEIDQIFYQENAQALDCSFVFPVPSDAAVHRCEMHVNGRVVRACVRDHLEAQRLFQEAKSKGHRGMIVESERDNLFTLLLGNVQPGDVVIVRLAYVEKVDRHRAERRLRIPFCPGIRYVPGRPLLRSPRGRGVETDTDEVPDASRITPPRIDALHPDAAYLSLTGVLALGDAAAETLRSRTHTVTFSADDGAWCVRLGDQSEVPDRDFVIAWREPVATVLEARASRVLTATGACARLQLRAPQGAVADAAGRPATDVYLLVDRSGSMQGRKWTKTCEAVRSLVGALPREDRVAVTFFESGFRDFSEAPLPTAKLLEDPAFAKIAELGVGGGTELLPAARHLLAQKDRHSAGRRSHIVIITDGQVGNEAAILDEFRPHAATPVFTLGIDTAVNDLLLRRLATQHGGLCRLLTPHDDIVSAVRDTVASLLCPALSQIEVRAPWRATSGRPANLFGGETAEFFCETDDAEATHVEIAAVDAAGERMILSVRTEASTNEAIVLLHARERILAAEAARETAVATALSLKHNLLCSTTAFVGWDATEKVVIARQEIDQPVMFNDSVRECIRSSFHNLCEPVLPPIDTSRWNAKAFTDWLDARLAVGSPVASANASVGLDAIEVFLFMLMGRFWSNPELRAFFGRFTDYLRTLSPSERIAACYEFCEIYTAEGGADAAELRAELDSSALTLDPSGLAKFRRQRKKTTNR